MTLRGPQLGLSFAMKFIKATGQSDLVMRRFERLGDGYANQDLLDVFYREYRNLPIATENQAILKKSLSSL